MGPKGVQAAKGDRGERGECGVKGEKGIQLATRYGEKMRFIKYHVSDDRSSIVELAGGVGTPRCVSAYQEPAWHFDAKSVSGQRHEMANVQKSTCLGHFLEIKKSAYHCPYNLASNKVNALYIVYKVREYDSTGMEHNYPFSCGMGNNHRGIYFLKNENTMRVHGAVGDLYGYFEFPNQLL